MSSSATITATADDSDDSNNESTCTTVTVGSFDPNDMQVFPKEEFISAEDTLLHYFIRFQNTGSDTAYTVIVRDTLEINLTKESIQSIASSHPCELKVKGNIAEFIFNDIDLLDSTFNEPKSHGFVSYYIKRKKNMLPGESVKNKSDIYFDFNLPIATNRVKSTVELGTTGLSSANENSISKAYPMPFSNSLTVESNSKISKDALVKVISLNGEDLGSVPGTVENDNRLMLDMSTLKLQPGIYVVKIIDGENVSHVKVLKGSN